MQKSEAKYQLTPSSNEKKKVIYQVQDGFTSEMRCWFKEVIHVIHINILKEKKCDHQNRC